MIPEGTGAELAGGGEGDLFHGFPAAFPSVSRLQRLLRRVGVVEGPVQVPEDLCQRSLVQALRGEQLFHLQLAGGNGTGLVRAENVDAGQGLDGLHFLNEGALFRQAADAEDKGDRGEEHQPLGDHADDAGNGADHGVREIFICLVLAPEEQEPDRNDQDRDCADDAADGALHLGGGPLSCLRLFRELRGIAGISDLFRGHAAGPGGDEAAGEDGIARLFPDRLRLAGEHGFVELQAGGRQHRSVGDDLVAGAEKDDFVGHQLLHRDGLRAPVPEHGRAGGGDDGKLVDQGLDLQFLEDADAGIADDHAQKEHVLVLPGEENEEPQQKVQQVEIGEGMGPDDLAGGPGAGGGAFVHGSVLDAPADFPVRESPGEIILPLFVDPFAAFAVCADPRAAGEAGAAQIAAAEGGEGGLCDLRYGTAVR